MAMTSHKEKKLDPVIASLIEKYPHDVIAVAGSVASEFTVAHVTDILEKDELLEYYSAHIADNMRFFSHASEKGFKKELQDKARRQELARAAFGYLSDVRQLWYRDHPHGQSRAS